MRGGICLYSWMILGMLDFPSFLHSAESKQAWIIPSRDRGRLYQGGRFTKLNDRMAHYGIGWNGGRLYGALLFDAVNYDGTDGTYGTEVFAGSATDAALGIDHRTVFRLFTAIQRYDADGSCRTVAGTVAAVLALVHQTIFADDSCRSDFCAAFLCKVKEPYGIRGAHLGAAVAFRPAISMFIPHFGLHEVVQFR